MKELERPYLTGTAPPRPLPLGRFMPPAARGVLSAWLEEQLSGGQWLLDPLGANPALIIEAARAGYRVLVASNNPVLTFMLETLAAAPHPASFQPALAELVSSRRGDERLEVHLQALYQTSCPTCGQLSQAPAFLWRKGESAPYARLVRCPACGNEGEYPITEADLDRLRRIGSDSLHRSRAAERVISAGEAERPAVEEALKSYLPRPLYVLFTLINKVEGLAAAPERKRLLTALILSLCDEAGSLWPWPSGRARPRQLTIPPTFRENNLWLALEAAVPAWCDSGPPVPLVRWPVLPPPEGGICLYPGRLRGLIPQAESLHPAAAFAVLPRPNNAFWTLSALWAGWLWGREAVAPLKAAFERRRYDWNWHAGALYSVFSGLRVLTPPGTPFFAQIPELAPGFLAAIAAAAQAAGLRLDGFALRSDQESAQAQWRSTRGKPSTPGPRLDALFREGMSEHLERRGEPAPYLNLYTAGLLHAVQNGGLPAHQPQVNAASLGNIQAAAAAAFNQAGFIRRTGDASANAESGLWWLTGPAESAAPLSDRVEEQVVHLLEKLGQASPAELESGLCMAFPGLLTPPADWLRLVFEAFSEPVPGQADLRRKRPGAGEPESRAALGELAALAARLSYTPAGELPQLWKTAQGDPHYAFYPAGVGRTAATLLGGCSLAPGRCVLVFPAEQTRLITARLQLDPRLAAAAAGWRFLSTAVLRDYLRGLRPNRINWQSFLEGCRLPGQEITQMPMF